MNDSPEQTELEEILRDCRNLYASLSEKNLRAVGPWPGASDPVKPFSSATVVQAESPPHSEGEAGASAPHEFNLTLIRLQEKFFSSWRKLLQAHMELERIGRDRAREQSELARLSEQVMLLSQFRAEAAEEKDRLRRELELHRIEVAESRGTIERLQLLLTERENISHSLSEQTARLAKDIELARERETQLTEALSDLENVKTSLEVRLEDLEREVNGLRAKVDPVESELDAARSRIAELEGALPSEEKERLQREIEILQAEKQSLESSSEALARQVESLEEIRAENERLGRESADLQARLSEAEARSEAISLSQGDLEVRFAASLTDLESYREQFNRLERENARLKDELAAASSTGAPRSLEAARVEETAPEPSTSAAFDTDSSPPSKSEPSTLLASPTFPYPEITPQGLEKLAGRRILLVGGDIRFQADYEHLFTMVGAEVEYFPSIIHLEKQGMKNSVRDSHLVAAFGGATQEPGLFRLRKICSDYGRHLLEHPSSGLVSLSHRLKQAVREL